MTRKGRELELLVSRLEELLHGTSIDIKSPDYIPDKETGVLREVDVALRSRIGSSEILVIVECRDRDSVQDVTWIEQLAAKSRSVGANMMVAVSTSGFTAPAAQKARARGIEVRSVDTLGLEDVRAWFQAPGMEIYYPVGAIETANFYFSEATPDEAAEVVHHIRTESNAGRPVLRWRPTDDIVGLNDILLRVPESASKDLPLDGTVVKRTLRLGFPLPAVRYSVSLKARDFDVAQIDVSIRLWLEPKLVEPSALRAYRSGGDDGADLAHIIDFQFDVAGVQRNIELARDPATGRIRVGMTQLLRKEPEGNQ